MVEFTSEKPRARLEAIHRGVVGAGAVSICICHGEPLVTYECFQGFGLRLIAIREGC